MSLELAVRVWSLINLGWCSSRRISRFAMYGQT